MSEDVFGRNPKLPKEVSFLCPFHFYKLGLYLIFSPSLNVQKNACIRAVLICLFHRKCNP